VSDPETASDAERFHPGYGHGGVPWLLMLLYIAFLVFFTWYVLEFQLPDYLEKGPVKPAVAPAATK
jgi:hypothetical protein